MIELSVIPVIQVTVIQRMINISIRFSQFKIIIRRQHRSYLHLLVDQFIPSIRRNFPAELKGFILRDLLRPTAIDGDRIVSSFKTIIFHIRCRYAIDDLATVIGNSYRSKSFKLPQELESHPCILRYGSKSKEKTTHQKEPSNVSHHFNF